MDCQEEQSMELEALEAILGEGGLLAYEGQTPDGWHSDRTVYKVKVEPEDEEQHGLLNIDLLFQHTETYPETLPHIKVSNTRGISDADAVTLTAYLVQTAEANLGMASIFAVMQAGKEWLEDKIGMQEAVDPAVLKKQQEDAEEQARAESRAHGTPVTATTFAAWRAKFDAELQELRGAAAVVDVAAPASMTGRQWFTEKHRAEAAAVENASEGESSDAGDQVGDSADDEDTDFDFEAEDDIDEDEFLDDFLANAEAV